VSEDDLEIHRPDRAEALKQKEAWETLLKSPGWSMVAAFLAEQKKVRIVKLLTEPDMSDKELHFIRGEAASLELVEKFPQTMLETSAGILEALRGYDGRPDTSNGIARSEPEPLPRDIHDVDLPPDFTQQ
jgi:hypothetical protein